MAALPARVLAVADRYWAGALGVSADQLRPRAPFVVPHAGEWRGYEGVYLQSFGGAAPIALLPPQLVDTHADRLAAVLRDGLLVDEGRWREVFGDLVERFVGPAEIRYVDGTSLRSTDPGVPTRLLTEEDAGLLAELERAFDPAEWEQAGSALNEHPLAGVFVDGALAAVASYRVWNGVIAHVSIATHPAHRGRGLGAAAEHRVAREAIDRGLVVQHRALASNAPSIALAERLGFTLYALSLAIRLRL